MKNLISMGLSTIIIFTLSANTVKAQTKAQPHMSSNSTTQVNRPKTLTPFQLVYLGYQGSFKNQGIPSYGRFIAASQAMDIHAEDLVKAAVQGNLLSQESLSDRSYLGAVKIQLQSLSSS